MVGTDPAHQPGAGWVYGLSGTGCRMGSVSAGKDMELPCPAHGRLERGCPEVVVPLLHQPSLHAHTVAPLGSWGPGLGPNEENGFDGKVVTRRGGGRPRGRGRTLALGLCSDPHLLSGKCLITVHS